MSSATNDEILAAVDSLAEQVKRIADVLQGQLDRKEYHAEYYKKRKAQKEAKGVRLSNRNKHCLMGQRDTRLPSVEWAEKFEWFSENGLSVYNFVTWMAWTWNQNTFEHVPITKSGGYLNVMIGLSGKKPLRQKYSERDVTGHLRVNVIRKPEQVDILSDALWWKWTFNVLLEIHAQVAQKEWFKKKGERWVRPFKLACAPFAELEVRGTIYDPHDRDLQTHSKMYSCLRPTLSMLWGSFLRGLHAKVEPFKMS
jgi:hypothetical protein